MGNAPPNAEMKKTGQEAGGTHDCRVRNSAFFSRVMRSCHSDADPVPATSIRMRMPRLRWTQFCSDKDMLNPSFNDRRRSRSESKPDRVCSWCRPVPQIAYGLDDESGARGLKHRCAGALQSRDLDDLALVVMRMAEVDQLLQ